MIPTAADRALAQTFVACMEDEAAKDLTLADTKEWSGEVGLAGVALYEQAKPEQLWEAAFLLVAVARRAGWAPPPEKSPLLCSLDNGYCLSHASFSCAKAPG